MSVWSPYPVLIHTFTHVLMWPLSNLPISLAAASFLTFVTAPDPLSYPETGAAAPDQSHLALQSGYYLLLPVHWEASHGYINRISLTCTDQLADRSKANFSLFWAELVAEAGLTPESTAPTCTCPGCGTKACHSMCMSRYNCLTLLGVKEKMMADRWSQTKKQTFLLAITLPALTHINTVCLWNCILKPHTQIWKLNFICPFWAF